MPAVLRSRLAPIALLVVIIAALTPMIAGSAFWLDNSVLVAIFALLALSVGMAYGQAGILSMAPAAFGAIGAFATSIVTTRYGLSPLVGLALALLLPAVVAYPMARAITRLSPLPLSIATLLLSLVLELAIREGKGFTGGYIGISGIPPLWFADSVFAMHVLSWGLVVVVLFLYANLTDSAVGRAVKTARHDPLRATADGVNVPALLASYFAISASVSGLAGWLYAHHLTYMGPDSLTMHVSIKVVLMAVIGGASTLLGPVLGAAFLTLLTLYLPAAETQGMIFGGVLIFVLLVAPNGMLGTDWGKLVARRSSKQAVAVRPATTEGTA
ncbi:branched-chain amino acid ABC transporter permease [Rhodopseudomonas sp. HC1]|uniref:branched-chain amino acid ABC transporter permease n=1 Tax=Rhodopseudomonas infernalis TaxID=2897386 RepID=UPI001EE96455|nr:branched-chain amino acid ABC transporter permease [Rhodopseudomonas infernalis]MCG6205997.1 branched-chain amino acid ABC transporter permease [Rhodopseudomonas infernalis]